MLKSTVIVSMGFGVLELFIGAIPVAASSTADTAKEAIAHVQSLNSQGAQQWEPGQADVALKTWRQAETAYTAAGDEMEVYKQRCKPERHRSTVQRSARMVVRSPQPVWMAR